MKTNSTRIQELEKTYYGLAVSERPLETVTDPVKSVSSESEHVVIELSEEGSCPGEVGAASQFDDLASLDIGLSIELGRVRLTAGELLDLEKGSVLEVSYERQEPIELKVGGESVGRGKLVFEGETLFLEITSLCFDLQEN